MIRNNAVEHDSLRAAAEAVIRGNDETEVTLIAQMDRTIRHYNGLISALQNKVATLRRARAGLTNDAREPSVPTAPTEVPVDFAPRQRERKGTIAWTVRREAYAILRQHGRPMNRTELLDAIVNRGVKIDTANAKKSVSRILWQAPEFEHLDTGYWIKNTPLPSEAE